jgi:bifunctional non-homologous end joining protein LigD
MALEKYKAKRNFTESPEPSGDLALAKTRSKAATGRTPRFFCVQKHLASHLHYDFRLEHDGVLLSWAVPKGPSLDPATKRLAMHVEDHPIEYGEFEGVIPAGYGAGIVMLWDRGTWTPEVDDVDAALKKGDLKFTLDGYKLKGSWVLVRTGGWGSRGKAPGGKAAGDGRSWLLIKHRDEWAGEVDIDDFAPLSVKSEGNFAEILSQDDPDIWRSHRPAEGGEAGAMFKKIVEQALSMKRASRGGAKKASSVGAISASPVGANTASLGGAKKASSGGAKRASSGGATKASRGGATSRGGAVTRARRAPATKKR